MTGEILKFWLMIAWLLPLAGFVVQMAIGMASQKPAVRRIAGIIAIACIAGSFVCSVIAFVEWGAASEWSVWQEASVDEDGVSSDGVGQNAMGDDCQTVWSGSVYDLSLIHI